MTSATPREDSIDAFLARCTPAVRRLVEAARRRVLEVVPEATERLRAGWGLVGYDAPRYFAFVAPAADHVRIGFERGTLLEDPSGLLEGTGAQVRHVAVRTARAVRAPALAALLRQAAELGRPRGAPEPAGGAATAAPRRRRRGRRPGARTRSARRRSASSRRR